MTDTAFIKLGDTLKELNHQAYLADKPGSNMTSAQRTRLSQRILNVRLNIMRMAAEDMVKRFGKADEWALKEITDLEKEIKSNL